MGYNNVGIWVPDQPSVIAPGTAPSTTPVAPVTPNPAPTAPITSSNGQSPTQLVNSIANPQGNGVINPATGMLEYPNTSTPTPAPTPAPAPTPVVATSDAERLRLLRESLGIGATPTPTSSPEDTAALNTARAERTAITTEEEQIVAERTKLQEEWANYKLTAGEGVSMGGMQGALDENGRKIQAKLDSLNNRELVLETKLTNRNNVINEIMTTNRQNYQDSVAVYNTQFSQALQLYSILDKQDSELQQSAKANLDVLANAYGTQIQSGQLTIGNGTPTFYKPDPNNATVYNAQGQPLSYDQYIAQGGKADFSNTVNGKPVNSLTPMQMAKINELETQAGLPMGSTLAVLQTLKPGEEKLYSGVDKNGTFSYVTKNANGEISVKKIAGVEAPSGTANGVAATAAEEKQIQAFQNDASDWITKLGADKTSWGTAWNSMHAKYPQASNELLDATLGKDTYYNYTGANA